jgi:AcrR family transcriptional regulator
MVTWPCFNAVVADAGANPIPRRRVGRPSLADERRAAIVDSFIRLAAERGLEGITLDDVAAQAGVQRAAARHFVGNRAELIEAAITELVDRYESSFRNAIGPAPTIEALIDALFSKAWVVDLDDVGSAFDVMMQEAVRHPALRASIKQAYEVLLSEIELALQRSRPAMSVQDRRNVAYSVACLAEQNVLLQQVGFAPARSVGARAAALALVAPA